MTQATDDIVTRYNYDEFVPEKFQPWMRFDESPPLGEPASDFLLVRLDDETTCGLNFYTLRHADL